MHKAKDECLRREPILEMTKAIVVPKERECFLATWPLMESEDLYSCVYLRAKSNV